MNLKRIENKRKMMAAVFGLIILSVLLFGNKKDVLAREAVFAVPQAGKDSTLLKDFQAAKARLRMGINTWNSDVLKEARDLFIRCLMKNPAGNVRLYYYVALTDYRLASLYLASRDNAEAERFNNEEQQYLDKALAVDPSSGECLALYGYCLGVELAFHPEKAMTLGFKSFDYFVQAEGKEPENPRIQLLRGIYMLYVPQEFGGGPDSALSFLEKSASLYKKDKSGDPFKPDWGEDETYTYLGLIHKQKKDIAKALEMLHKALAVNPDCGRAKAELAALEK